MVSLKKVLVSNHKVKTVNFPDRKSEKQSDDLIIYVGTNDLTNNVNVLKILKEVSKEPPLTSIAISSIIKGKDETDIRKNQLRMFVWKCFGCKKQSVLLIMVVLRNFIWVREIPIWIGNEKVPLQKYCII